MTRRELEAGRCVATRGHDTAQGRARLGYDTAGCGHAIRSCERHDTTPSALYKQPGRSARAVGVQPGPLGVHLCTQPSFGLSALFQSLFGPMFMNTVHKIFSKKIK